MLRPTIAIIALSLLGFSQVGGLPPSPFDITGVLGATAGTTGGTSPTGGARGVADETCWEDGNANVVSADINAAGTEVTYTNESGETIGPVSGRAGANGGMAHSNPHAPAFADGTKPRIRAGIVQTKAPGGSWQNNTRTACSSPSTGIDNGTVGQRGIDNGTVGLR